MLTNEALLALWSGGSVGVTRPVLGSLKVIAFARAVERAAYERAAQECEKHSGPIETYNRAYPHYLECADAIRALKERA